MLNECSRFSVERCLSVNEIEGIEVGHALEKVRRFAFDITAWDRDPENRPLTSHRAGDGIVYKFRTSGEQVAAVKNYMEGLSHKGKEFQLKRLCEPFYGIKKEYLNFYVSKE